LECGHEQVEAVGLQLLRLALHAKFMGLEVGQPNKQMGVVAVECFVVIDLLDDQVDEVEQLHIAPAAR